MTEYEDFVGSYELFDAITWCDQSASPPAKARDTHALQFMFEHRPHGLQESRDERLYSGLLFYTPPSAATFFPSNTIGFFQGAGFSGAPDPSDPWAWVRITIRIGRSNRPNPDGLYKVWILGDFRFSGRTDRRLGGGPDLQASWFESDVSFQYPGESKPLYMVVDLGRLYYRKTTVLMP
jgi:hypothetical protein